MYPLTVHDIVCRLVGRDQREGLFEAVRQLLLGVYAAAGERGWRRYR